MTIQIDKDVPRPPPPTVGRPFKYPFPAMRVGDSFAVPLAHATTLKGEDVASARMRSSAISYGRKNGRKFTVRTDREAGVARCWRVE